MIAYRTLVCALLALFCFVAPASAARPIVDLHNLDAYFALFAADSNVPWEPTTVRLDTYTDTPVDFAIYQVDPADVLTADSSARSRAIDLRGRKPVATFRFSPPGGYQFNSSKVPLPLGSREGFFVLEARRGNVGEQVWINRSRIGLLTKETAGELMLYGADLGNGRALAHMRISCVAGGNFIDRQTDSHGILIWNRAPRPIFALAQWGASYAFVGLLPQAPLPATIVGVRTASAVVHAGDPVHIVGFARTRSGQTLRAASGTADVSMRLGGTVIGDQRVTLDAAGAFSATIPVPGTAIAGDYAVLAQTRGGVGSASVHVDADAQGLSLQVLPECDGTCDPNADIPLEIVASRGNVPVHITVVRSPHIDIGYTPATTRWGTGIWLDKTIQVDGNGHAMLSIAKPTDGLASTYGVQAESGGATADTRIIVPTARVALRLQVDRDEQMLDTPVSFGVYANEVGSGKPFSGATITVKLQHGSDVQQQVLRLDAAGYARGAFSSPELGTSLIFASTDVDGAQAIDASEVQIVAQATSDTDENGSGDVRIALDQAVYHSGDEMRIDADRPGAEGDALLTLESGLGVQTVVSAGHEGHASARIKVNDAVGELRVGAAFVADGAIDWTSVPLALDAPGRPASLPLTIDREGALATVMLHDALAGPGTLVVRVSRGEPSGTASFGSAPMLLAVGLAATQNSAPSGTTWHPWVDSSGERAQVLGFERRTQAPVDLTLAQSDAQPVSWSIERESGTSIPLQLPTQRGRYTVSVLKIADDGRVTAASSTVVVE